MRCTTSVNSVDVEADPVGAPSSLTATAASDEIDLSWNSVAEASGYEVFRVAGPGASTSVAITPTGFSGTTWADTGLTAGTSYSYVVVSLSLTGSSNPTSAVSAMPVQGPNNLQAVAGDGSVSLTWNAGDEATSFVVYRGTSPSNITTLLTPTPVSTTSFTDNTVTDYTPVYYAVYGVTADGLTAPTNDISAIPALVGDVVTGLIHHYSLASDATDSIEGDDGTSSNGPTFSGNGSVSFNGIDQAVVVPDTPDMEFTATDNFTVSVWVNASALTGQWQGVVTKSRNDAPWYGIWIDSTGHFVFGNANIYSNAEVVPGVWYYVTAVQDGDTVRGPSTLTERLSQPVEQRTPTERVLWS